MENWFQNLNEKALIHELSPSLVVIIQNMEATGLNLDQICQVLSINPGLGLATKGNKTWPSDLWQKTRDELRLIICTDDSKYRALRDDLKKETNVTSAVILSLISTTVSSQLGLAAGLITPFVVLLLVTMLTAGKEAWCTQMKPSNLVLPKE